ncbi:MAG: hypothetical protein AB1451_12575 [Nitrospirota bacterium]
MTTFLSTAFLQQCFAMHRYDLVVKRVTSSGVVVSCKACKIRHAARLGPWDPTETEGATRPATEEAIELITCATDHLAAVSVQTVDVQRDCLEIACRQCRNARPFRILECVTRSLSGGSGL